MVWTPNWPDTTKSVRTNGPTGSANSAYIDTTMNLDHYWNAGGTDDGHHKWAQMKDLTTDPKLSLIAGDYGMICAKAKAAAESPDNQDIQPFYVNENTNAPVSTQLMQLMGIRSCGLVTITPGAPPTVVTNYSHNMTSITYVETGVYTVTFPLLPTANYLPFVMALRNGAAGLSAYATIGATTKTTTGFNILVQRQEDISTRTDPAQLWYFVFGG